MAEKPKATPEPKSKPEKDQSARDLEVDESGKAFERAIDVVLPKKLS